MNIEQIKLLVKGALSKDASVNFEDGQNAAVKALLEYYGLNENSSYREIKRATNGNFAIIEEVIDELLPAELENIMGQWAEIKQFGRDEEVKFNVPNLGKKRALLSIVPGARGGLYKARRLDSKSMTLSTKVYTAAVYVTLEDILLNRVTLGELMDNILKGITYQVYVEVVNALRTIHTIAPAGNKCSAEGLKEAEFDGLVRVVSAYGNPVIVCFESFANKFSNTYGDASKYNPNLPSADLDDIRNYGRVQVYKGRPIVVVPNFITNEANTKWAFSEADCFILPAGYKPVRVGMQGDGYIAPVHIPSGGEEEHFHKIMGVGLMLVNNCAVYRDTTIAQAETGKVEYIAQEAQYIQSL
jgi:hypothetical protein